MSVSAVILLAGNSIRMQSFFPDIPKSLITIGDKPLLWYSINNLRKVGISDFIFVVGYQAEKIKSFGMTFFKDVNIRYIQNYKYEKTNSVYSYYLAIDTVLNNNYLRLEGDLLYSSGIIKRLLKKNISPASAVEKKVKKTLEEYSVIVNRNNKTILKFGKDIPKDLAYGEAKGIEYISAYHSYDVNASLKQLIPDQSDVYAEIAYQNMINQNKRMCYVELNEQDFWCEVDTPEDLEFARKHYRKCI
jgi:choline kinase